MHQHEAKNPSRTAATILRGLLARESFESIADLVDVLKFRCSGLRIRLSDDDINDALRVVGSNTPLVASPVRPVVDRPADPPPLSKADAARLFRELMASRVMPPPDDDLPPTWPADFPPLVMVPRGDRPTNAATRRPAAPAGRDVDAATVARLSALPEDYALAYLWRMAPAVDDRLALLWLMAHVVIDRPATWNAAAICRAHNDRVDWQRVAIDRARCFGCDNGHEYLYFHHVIEVFHGGSNTPRNQVPICFACHRFLHPWLIEEPVARVRVRGFDSLWDLDCRQSGCE